MEKVKVNIPYAIYNLLFDDMETFKFYKNNNEVNKNLFMNKLIKNLYLDEKAKKEKTFNYLNNVFKNNKINDSNDNIKNKIYNLTNTRSFLLKEKNTMPLSFRPNKDNIETFEFIDTNLLNNDSLSSFIRRLLNTYFSYTQAEREIIMFRDEFNTINKAINTKTIIKINTNTSTFKFKPIIMSSNNEDTFIYIKGLPMQDNPELKTLHLYNIKNIIPTLSTYQLSKKEEELLQESKNSHTIAYSDDFDFCNAKVYFTQEGINKYKRIWFNRPRYYDIDKDNYYYFYAPKRQLLHYFVRFGSDALIIEPKNLFDEIKSYFKESYSKYQEYDKN